MLSILEIKLYVYSQNIFYPCILRILTITITVTVTCLSVFSSHFLLCLKLSWIWSHSSIILYDFS